VRRFLVGTALLISATSAAADDLVPLEQLLKGQPDESYQHVRCAAFYLANIEWAGQAISQTLFDETRAAISALFLVAALQRATKTEGDVQSSVISVNADARAITELYEINYRQSYAVRGAAWDGNPLWESDAETCRPIGEAALRLSAALEKGQ
jgi:hypothetical protein